MPLQIMRNDITKVKADAIVNTANPLPKYAAGTDAAIYKAAGADKLLAERKKIGKIDRGDVAVTQAFDLNAKYIIHTVGPAWKGGDKGEFDSLRSCYAKSLAKAAELKCRSIAFPLIATGIYGFPKAEALSIAMNEIGSFLMKDDVDMTVKLVVFDTKAFRLSQNLFFQVESFINDEDVIETHKKEYGLDEPLYNRHKARWLREIEEMGNEPSMASIVPDAGKHISRKPFDEHSFDKEQFMYDKKDDRSFQDHLLKLIIEKKLDNSYVYKHSNVTKGAFSKILCGDTKRPQKKTVLGFCIGLELNLEEAKELLASADMAFNPYSKRDKLVIECIERGQYKIDDTNSMLFLCEQPLLGS